MTDYPNYESRPLTDFIAQNFIINGVKCFYGFNKPTEARNTLTLEQFDELHRTKGLVLKNKEGKFSKFTPPPMNTSQNLLASMNHQNLYCVDLDEPKLKWDDIPDILKDCPFSLSRNKKLPHLFFRIDGLDHTRIKSHQNATENLNFCKGELLTGTTWERKDGHIYNWNGTIPTLQWSDVSKLLKPEEVKKFNHWNSQAKQAVITEYDTDDTADLTDDTASETEPRDLQTARTGTPPAEITTKPAETTTTKPTKPAKPATKYDEIDRLMGLLAPTRWETYSEWFKIGQLTKNELGDEGLPIFVKYSKPREQKEGETATKYIKDIKATPANRKDRLTIGTLKMWVKQDNPAEYVKIYGTDPAPIASYVGGSHFDVAKFIVQMWGGDWVCVDGKHSQWYIFQDGLWVFDGIGNSVRNAISSVFGDYLREKLRGLKAQMEKETDADKTKTLEGYIKTGEADVLKSGDRRFKDNVLREMMELKYDPEFEAKANKAPNVIPIQGGKLFHLLTNEITERTKDDLFTFECPVSYIPYDAEIEGFQFAEKYLNDLFTNITTDETTGETIRTIDYKKRQCVMDIVKSAIKGRPLRYLFLMTGSGRNGKSVFLKLINLFYGSFMDVISKLVIIKQKGNHTSVLNTEMEKLEHCRIGFVSELADTDAFNECSVKAITGGDPINLRTICSKDRTIVPTCSLFGAMNETPSFKGTDKALCDRMINIPFKNKFENNVKYEDEVMNHKDYIFSFIMKEGRVLDNFELTDEMKQSTQELIANNRDTLEEFLNESLVPLEPTEPNTGLPMDDLRQAYNQYLRSIDQRPFDGTKTKFTKMCKGAGLTVKESHSVNKFYNRKFRPAEEEAISEQKERIEEPTE